MNNLEKVLIEALAEVVEGRDAMTRGHVGRVRVFMGILLDEMAASGVYGAEMLGIDIDAAVVACQLHDVGKIGFTDGILSKKEALSDGDFEFLKMHTALGGRIIDKMLESAPDNIVLQYAKVIAQSHHERWDGGGYHKGLKGEEIPLLGRVMAVVDVYDALISKRPYKEAFSHEKAVEIIKNDDGIHFDPAIVNLFSKIHHKFEEAALS